MAPLTIDAHAHILDTETIDLLQREVPSVAPSLTPIDDDFAVLTVAGHAYKPFPRGGWDLERRLDDMERYGFDRQVLAVCPQTVLYDQDPQITLTASQIQNDQIAALVRARPDRFHGLATVPMQAPELAAAELRRAITDRGLSGAMIGSNTNGRNLDDPALEPFWHVASDLEALILVHPLQVAGIDRQRSYYLQNFIGNPLDTTIAAACLVFGGVIERNPGINFLMSHGGGFTPYQAARWEHGWTMRAEARVTLTSPPCASLDRLIYDTILHDVAPLQFLVDHVGPDRVLLGSDYPFDMGQYDAVNVVNSLRLPAASHATILGGAALSLLQGRQ
jgi:aminocarboxymuconate-semialdehyde decarboxylase